tara:strand:+ start:2535 stop:3926 length:1392 start_codon:yes stop_codon:yes gene_type:complete
MLLKIIGIIIFFFVIGKILNYAGFTEDKKNEIRDAKEKKKKTNVLSKEKFINRELKDRGVGTFGSLQFTYDKEKRKDENLYDMSNLDKEEIKTIIDNNKKEKKNILNEIKNLKNTNKKNDDEGYFIRLEEHLKNLDDYIFKMEKIYSKLLLKDEGDEGNEGDEGDEGDEKLRFKPIQRKDKLSIEEQELLYSYPSSNLLSISDDRNILETRIQSFNTDVKIVNEKKIIHELDNKVFDKEIKKSIDQNKQKYVSYNLNYEYIDDEDNVVDIDSKNSSKDVAKEVEEQGFFRKIEYNNVSKKNIEYFDNIEKYILDILNKNKKLKITGGYQIIKTTNFIVVQKKINYILYNKKNKKEYIYDCEVVVYRESKNHGKHIRFKVLVNHNKIYLLDVKVIGIVSEDRIMLLKASNEYVNNLVYYKYKNKYVITYNPRESEIAEMSINDRIFLMRDRKNKLRQDRGLTNN